MAVYMTLAGRFVKTFLKPVLNVSKLMIQTYICDPFSLTQATVRSWNRWNLEDKHVGNKLTR